MDNRRSPLRVVAMAALVVAAVIATESVSSQGNRNGQRPHTTRLNGHEVVEGEVLVRYRANIGALARRLAESTVEADEAAPSAGAVRGACDRVAAPRARCSPPSRTIPTSFTPNPISSSVSRARCPTIRASTPCGDCSTPANQSRIPRHPRRRHQRHAGVGHHHRIARPRRRRGRHRHRLQPSRPGREHVDRRRRVHVTASAASNITATPARMASTPSPTPAIRWTTTGTARTWPARSARSATTASASPA